MSVAPQEQARLAREALTAATPRGLLNTIIAVTHQIADTDAKLQTARWSNRPADARRMRDRVTDLRAMRADLSAELLSRIPEAES